MHEAERAATVVRALAKGLAPRVGLILGSGLGSIADAIEDAVDIGYQELPGFPASKVAGHAGRLVVGRLAGTPVVCLKGRAHLYEGAPAQALQVPVRTLKLVGCSTLFITNAAGSTRRTLKPGALMLISDHVNLTGMNPLIGANDDNFGPRFPAMEDAYDPELRADLLRLATGVRVRLREGVYLACLGPSYETPAEIRAFATMGADAVGMSTVPEVIVARHCGLKVAAISVITNFGAGLGELSAAHERVLDIAATAARDLGRLIQAWLAELAQTAP
ncbi:MAG: purine-nucleoside phosphorylase [Alphaproteobacteria bacterium]|nr:purine-nucleoside phosphorylase [Alphaproteobacteria bacterium]